MQSFINSAEVKSIPAVRTAPRAEPDYLFKHFEPQPRKCIELQLVS